MSNAFRVPVAFFGMVLWLVGFGACWRVAHKIWGIPSAASEGVTMAGLVV